MNTNFHARVYVNETHKLTQRESVDVLHMLKQLSPFQSLHEIYCIGQSLVKYILKIYEISCALIFLNLRLVTFKSLSSFVFKCTLYHKVKSMIKWGNILVI